MSNTIIGTPFLRGLGLPEQLTRYVGPNPLILQLTRDTV
jgi:hypothetical protein